MKKVSQFTPIQRDALKHIQGGGTSVARNLCPDIFCFQAQICYSETGVTCVCLANSYCEPV